MLKKLFHKKDFWRNIFYAFIFIGTAISVDFYFGTSSYYSLLHRRFQEKFVQAENELQLRLDNLIQSIQIENIDDLYISKAKEFKDLAQKRKMYFYIYKSDSLIAWSDNRITEIEILPYITDYQQFVQLSNGWFYSLTRQYQNYKIIGLLLIKDNYSIKNEYLENNFNPIFQLPKNINVKSSVFKESYVLRNIHNIGVFSLDFSERPQIKVFNIIFLWICLLIGIYFFIQSFQNIVRHSESLKKSMVYFIVFSICFISMYLICRHFKIPHFVFLLDIFKVHLLTSIKFFHFTLGDIFLISSSLYFIVFFIYDNFKIDFSSLIKNKKFEILLSSLILIFLLSYFIIASRLFELIIYKSNYKFSIPDLFANPLFLIISVIITAMLFAVFIFGMDYYINYFLRSVNKIIWSAILVSFIVFTVLYQLVVRSVGIIGPITAILIFFILVFVRYYSKGEHKYFHNILLIGIYSLYSIILIFKVGEEKLSNDERQIVNQLATEHDKIAELLISDVSNKMMFDTTLKRHVIVDELDYPWIYKYVRKRYFSGYLDRYDLQLTICNEDDSVLIKPDNQLYHCFSFFNNLTQNRAEKITSHSYFLKNSNGRISYFIMVNYNKNSERFRIFIQLDSRLNIDVLGYPQFLISDDYSKNNLLKGYSYAKYYKNKISYQSGSFFYNVNSVKYPSFKGQYFKQSFGGYDHLFYKYDNDNLIVLSRPSLSFFDLLVSFSYLFIFNFILLNIILLSIQNQKFNLKLLIGGFRTRIQISLISLMLFSLLLVGGITIYFIIEQYNKKHFESISEKLQSIYLELENLLTEENKLTYIWRNEEYSNLESFLRHLSNIFSTDINLYNNKGQLVASSRSEIFEKGLCGNVINPYAYHQLLRNNKNEYIHFEKLGNQKYLSIYTPFINKRGAVIGYLNLPYFIQQSKIREEISSMILAIVNFYVLLMLIAIFVAVVLAKNITKPLEIIHESISQMKLGKGNIKIIYKGNDEIGNLISEYNKKVDELERSVELLSKIERESAWKEMARQVAHEIKNPLTPMKLNVQQLQKKWQQNHYLEDEYIQKVTKSIIEQIDNLSNIASAFSSLAKMPSPKNERININELIENIVQLFSDSRVKIYCNIGSTMNCYVLADKDQLSRVFINLITNAIQAIPSSIGEIKIYSFKEDKIKIIIEDNGVGISEEMRKKLFQPNFTTKSGGSGLGLAICKSIIDYIGGNISYEPNEPVGSKFILTLPFEII